MVKFFVEQLNKVTYVVVQEPQYRVELIFTESDWLTFFHTHPCGEHVLGIRVCIVAALVHENMPQINYTVDPS